jgi:hypothetical protein
MVRNSGNKDSTRTLTSNKICHLTMLCEVTQASVGKANIISLTRGKREIVPLF